MEDLEVGEDSLRYCAIYTVLNCAFSSRAYKRKQSEENQTLAWIYKIRQKPNKNLWKTFTLGFLRKTVNRVGEEAENQAKSGEKAKC
jgi:hypothetical protein